MDATEVLIMSGAHKSWLLAALAADQKLAAEQRQAWAIEFIRALPDVQRACFADTTSDADNVILTVAVREPLAALEMLINRDRFDALALAELSLHWPETSVFVPEH